MMKIEELLKSKRQEILAIAAKHGARNVRVFGSFARGEARPESDLDILVEMEPETSLMDHVALMQDLEDLLQRKVDVVSERALHWYIRTKCSPRQLHYNARCYHPQLRDHRRSRKASFSRESPAQESSTT